MVLARESIEHYLKTLSIVVPSSCKRTYVSFRVLVLYKLQLSCYR